MGPLASNNSPMRWMFLVVPLVACMADEGPRLIDISRPTPATFNAVGEAKAPPAADQTAVRKMAGDWIKIRATEKGWKSGGFAFIGELIGRPADDLMGGRYSVYRMTFKSPPHIGGEIQTDLLFYAQGKELLWPPETWPRQGKTPPGQNLSVIREGITHELRSRSAAR